MIETIEIVVGEHEFDALRFRFSQKVAKGGAIGEFDIDGRGIGEECAQVGRSFFERECIEAAFAGIAGGDEKGKVS